MMFRFFKHYLLRVVADGALRLGPEPLPRTLKETFKRAGIKGYNEVLKREDITGAKLLHLSWDQLRNDLDMSLLDSRRVATLIDGLKENVLYSSTTTPTLPSTQLQLLAPKRSTQTPGQSAATKKPWETSTSYDDFRQRRGFGNTINRS